MKLRSKIKRKFVIKPSCAIKFSIKNCDCGKKLAEVRKKTGEFKIFIKFELKAFET